MVSVCSVTGRFPAGPNAICLPNFWQSKQENQEFKTILGYTMSSGLACPGQTLSYTNKQKINKFKNFFTKLMA